MRALCPSLRIQAHIISILDTAKRDWLDYQGRLGGVTGSDQGKCSTIGRVVASGSPEARRKGLDDRVEINYIVKGPARSLTLFTFNRNEWDKNQKGSGMGGFWERFWLATAHNSKETGNGGLRCAHAHLAQWYKCTVVQPKNWRGEYIPWNMRHQDHDINIY